jgi:hypothetical protein
MYTYTSHNDCDNVTARVALRQDGRYAVSLFDDDSGNQLPIVRIYTDRADAVAYADILAGIAAPTGDTCIYL